MRKARIQLGFIIILTILAGSLLLSQKADPSSKTLFGLKRLQEKAFLKTKAVPQDRVDYMSNLLELRLMELQSLVNNKEYDYILPSALRYSATAGQITDLIIANNLTDKTDVIESQFLNHQKAIDALYVIYPKNTDNIEYKYIEDDFNYLRLYLDKLEKIQ